MRILLLAGLFAGLANADVNFVYSDFSSITGLTLNGDAAQSGSLLRLVPSVDTKSGTAYYTSPVSLSGNTGFSTSFEFNISIDPTSDLPPENSTSDNLESPAMRKGFSDEEDEA
jgi:hypothetical protein